ncbi:MAG: hypothetical protein JWQ38_1472 [Flavipsychrobacter sp.]|nr:hypothetical protein [Flavipsychrobacter sp.]
MPPVYWCYVHKTIEIALIVTFVLMWVVVKRLIVIVIVLSGYVQARAQSNYYEEIPKVFNGGLILGMNLAQVDGDTYYGFHKIGLHAGAQVYIHFTSKFGITMDLLYSQKGSRGQGVVKSSYIGTYVARYYMDLNYAEVPLTFHYKEHGLDFEAGLAYSRLINSNEYIQSDRMVVIDPVANAFGTSDIEYVVGASAKVYKKIYANARYEYSVISIRPNDRIPVSFGYGNNGQYNNVFNVRLIYMF